MIDKLSGAVQQSISVLRRYFRPSGSPPEMPKWLFPVQQERETGCGVSGDATTFRALVSSKRETSELAEAISKIEPLKETADTLQAVNGMLQSVATGSRLAFLFDKFLNLKWYASTSSMSEGRIVHGKLRNRHFFGYTFSEIPDSTFNELRDACDEAGMADRESGANIQKLFPNGVPDDPDIQDLAVKLNAEAGSGKSMSQIAREHTGENLKNDPKAQKLLARIRMLKKRGKLNL